MIGNLKPLEIVLIILVILLLFGAKKLPDMARSLGKSARILKSEAKQMKKDGGDGGGSGGSEAGGSGNSADSSSAPRTIQAAPGEVSDARPVGETQEPKRS
ncbi:twin-arginine translocase TatA/TatE family subunit [Streptomyces sp. AJS327]|uniref:Sec-independent protein translocase subunit TatA n=1 Tax=Streptomyces sp. AJS327 TaxID=2545265 RepID=UPI0015DE7692|nr:Sec-independent protein translocase subunit TatA [Streptomyces sp. AJS327]MBA0050703.1 twin-arginine translocase TatA/TatE family subunit [Streptomyces sp. AJS327]